MASITVSRKDLGDALAFASLGMSKRPVHPVLGGMRVTVSAGSLELAAFDYETTAAVTVPGTGEGSAQVLADGAQLAAAVKSLPKGKNVTASLTVTAECVTIACDGITASASLLPLGEYPALPAMPELSGVMDGAAFARSVTRVAACAGTDDTLPVLTCVQFASEAGQLRMAATDRYRLAVDSVPWTGDDGVTSVIPAAILVKFAKAMDETGKVSLHFAAGFAAFSDGTRTLTTHPNCGTFPKYRSLIPSRDSLSTLVLADAAQLRTAVERAGRLTARNERTGFGVSSGQVTVTATRDGQECGTQAVAAETDGPDAPAGFNAGYLASVLAGFSGPVWMGLKVFTGTDSKGESYSAVTKPVMLWADDDEFTAIVMPIRKQQ